MSIGWEVSVAIILAGIMFFCAYLFSKIHSEHYYLKILFLLGTMFFSLLGINYVKLLAEESAASANIISTLNTTYIAMLWFSITVLAIVMIIYLWKVVLGFKMKKRGLGYEAEYEQ